jgi:hypothetical protein
VPYAQLQSALLLSSATMQTIGRYQHFEETLDLPASLHNITIKMNTVFNYETLNLTYHQNVLIYKNSLGFDYAV